MVVRTKITVEPDLNALDLVGRLEEDVKEDFFDASQIESNPIIAFIKKWFNKLRPKSVHPFRWSLDNAANLRAAKWWFRKGLEEKPTDGTRYIRQGNFQKAFRTEYFEDRDKTNAGVKILGSSKQRFRVDSGKYRGSFVYNFLVGTFDQRKGAQWQLVGHRRTGWGLVNDLATKVFNMYTEAVMKRFKEIRATRKNR